MTTSSVHSPDSFFDFLKQSAKKPALKPCFLLGNGIIRYMSTAPSWTDVLNELAKKCEDRNGKQGAAKPKLVRRRRAGPE